MSNVLKQASRSQSPAQTEMRAESNQSSQVQEATSSKHVSERGHHSKSHSRDLSTQAAMLSSPLSSAKSTGNAAFLSSTPQQKSQNRSMEESPQKHSSDENSSTPIPSQYKGNQVCGEIDSSGNNNLKTSSTITHLNNKLSRTNEQNKERLKEREKMVDSLQMSNLLKQASRSQSPALIELRAEPNLTSQEGASSTSSKHSSERSHHSKTHSRDPSAIQAVMLSSPSSNKSMSNASLLLSPATPQQKTANRTLEDSPQKQQMSVSKLDHSAILPGTSSGYHSANVTYGFSSDENTSTPNLVQYKGNQVYDENDGTGSNSSSRAATAIAHLNNKVARTNELIRLEQTIRDDNVNEYLKLAANADKQQLFRIKAVFEKKNQKSAHSIAHLQKKLDVYQKKIKNWETHGSSSGQGSHRQPRDMLRDMGQGLKNVGGNIRDGITGLGGSVMSKPREFAHLIRNKFGSADNINQMTARNNWIDGRRPDGEGPHTLPGNLRSDSSGGGTPGGTQQGGTGSNTGVPGNKLTSEEGSECSSVTSSGGYQGQPGNTNLNDGVYSFKQIICELKDRRDEIEQISEKLDMIKTLSQEVSYLASAIQEERFRSERLEEQINDLTELHQNEVENLKQTLADVEEKVQYQSEERVRDIHEMLELCQTKISKVEHQAMQQQQYVNLEGIEGFNARVLAVKLINVVLTILQVVLLLVATVAGILMPFLRTRVRILTTSMVVVGVIFILQQWPELWEISSHLIETLRKAIVPNKGDSGSRSTDPANPTSMDDR